MVWLLFRLDDGYMNFFLYSFYFCVLFSLKMSILKKKEEEEESNNSNVEG